MTEQLPMTAEESLWHMAYLLTKEDSREIADHHDHECYAGALVMQELILKLYPEVPEVELPLVA